MALFSVPEYTFTVIHVLLYFKKFIYRLISLIVLSTFASTTVLSPVYAQNAFPLPVPGSMLALSPAYTPVMIKGMVIHPEDPFLFDFIIHPGEDRLQGDAFKQEADKLIKYFMASLTVSEKDMWVNLSPQEKDRIIPEYLSQTEMGRDLLSQDYMMKQLTASLLYPEHELGKKFWEQIYAKIPKGAEIPADALSKVWIIPDGAKIYAHEKGVFVADARLKVLMEGEYLKNGQSSEVSDQGKENLKQPLITDHLPLTTQMIKSILLPAIEHEINTGKTFASLRQIYNAVILATWYKNNLKTSILGKHYINQGKVQGIELNDLKMKERIYNQYLEVFQKGTFNLIKEEYDPESQEVITRKYISGGADLTDVAMTATADAGSKLKREVGASQNVLTRLGNVGEKNPVDIIADENEAEADQASLASITELLTQFQSEYQGGDTLPGEMKSISEYLERGHVAIYYFMRDFKKEYQFDKAISPQTLPKKLNQILGEELGKFKSGRLTVEQYFVLEELLQELYTKDELKNYSTIDHLENFIRLYQKKLKDEMLDTKGIHLGQLTGLLNNKENMAAVLGIAVDDDKLKVWNWFKINLTWNQFAAVKTYFSGLTVEEMEAYGANEAGLIRFISEIEQATEGPLVQLKGIHLGHLTGLLNNKENMAAVLGIAVDDDKLKVWNWFKINLTWNQFAAVKTYFSGLTVEEMEAYGANEAGMVRFISEIEQATEGPLVQLKGIHLGQLTGLLNSKEKMAAVLGIAVDDDKLKVWNWFTINLTWNQFAAVKTYFSGLTVEEMEAYGANEAGLIRFISEIEQATEGPLVQLKGIHLGHLTGLLNSKENMAAVLGIAVDDDKLKVWNWFTINLTWDQFAAVKTYFSGLTVEEMEAYGANEAGMVRFISEIEQATEGPLVQLKGIHLGHLTGLLNSKENMAAVLGIAVDDDKLKVWNWFKIDLTWNQFAAVKTYFSGLTVEEMEAYGANEAGMVRFISEIEQATEGPLVQLKGIHLGHLTQLLNNKENMAAVLGIVVDDDKLKVWNWFKINLTWNQFAAVKTYFSGLTVEEMQAYGANEAGMVRFISEIEQATEGPLVQLKGINLGHLTGLLNNKENMAAVLGIVVDDDKLKVWNWFKINLTWNQFAAVKTYFSGLTVEEMQAYGANEAGMVRFISEIEQATEGPLVQLKGIHLGQLTGLLNSKEKMAAVLGIMVDDKKLRDWNIPYINIPYEDFLNIYGIKTMTSPITGAGDQAMTGERSQSQMQTENLGGIDLNPEKINIGVQGQSAQFNFFNDPQILPNLTIQGLQPIIINITPVTNASLLLGRNETEPAELPHS